MSRLAQALALLTFVCAPAGIASAAQGAQSEYDKAFNKGIADIRAGHLDDGIAAFLRCVELMPTDSTATYNAACGYALKKDLDLAFQWLDKAADLGFGNRQSGGESNIDFARKDPDLQNLHSDPRFEQWLAKMAAARSKRDEARKAAEVYVAQSATYVPEALAKAETLPLLVVLHVAGATKEQIVAGRWKAIADELGFALVAPSGKYPTEDDPARGMAWFEDADDYVKTPWNYERSIHDAVSAFKKEHKLDPSRVLIAGEGQGGLLAQSVAISSPGLYKGALVLDAPMVEPLLSAKAAQAGKMGSKLAWLLDPVRALGDLPESVKMDDLVAAWQKSFEGWGVQATVETYTAPAEGAPLPNEKIVAALRGLFPAQVPQ